MPSYVLNYDESFSKSLPTKGKQGRLSTVLSLFIESVLDNMPFLWVFCCGLLSWAATTWCLVSCTYE